MHPFELAEDTPRIHGTESQYLAAIEQHYIQDVVPGKTVLEIASGPALISERILAHDPTQLVMLDPDPKSVKIGGVEFINEDVTFWLPQAPRFDVVFCFGLFYHVHHSLHLVELMVNHCQPETLVLDCVVAPHPMGFIREHLNTTGNRWTPGAWKSAPFNLNVPFHIFNESLDHMGYGLDSAHRLNCDFFQKSNSWVAKWQRR